MSNAMDRCSYRYSADSYAGACYAPRCDHSPDVPAYKRPGHAFVEPAPQPAPSGDEAKVRELARAEAESIATRWVPAHMTARQGMVDDITASLVRYRALGADAGKADGAREAHEKTAAHLRRVAAFCLLPTRQALQAQAGVSSALAAGLKMCRHGFVRDTEECDAFCDMTEREIARRGSEGK